MEEMYPSFYGISILEIIVLIVCLVMLYVPLVFYLRTIQNTLLEVSVEHRRMKPNLVWLQLIPFFGFIWQFIIVVKVADSLRIQFYYSKISLEEYQPGQGLGIGACIMFCVSIIPLIGFFTFFAAVVCWILYWIKINNYRKKLKESNLFDIGNNLIEY